MKQFRAPFPQAVVVNTIDPSTPKTFPDLPLDPALTTIDVEALIHYIMSRSFTFIFFITANSS